MDTVGSSSRLRRSVDFALRHHVITLVCTGVVYLGLATGLTWSLDPEPMRGRDYFPLQAEAFLQGRLDLDIDPERAKLDMSVYDGRVHLYWGPGNALLPLVIRMATGRTLSACLWAPLYALLGVIAYAALFARISRRHFPANPPWASLVFLVTLAFGTPVVYLAAWSVSPHTQSIALSFAAQGLLLLAFVELAETGRLAAAVGLALSLALALTTRLTTVFLLPGLIVGGLMLAPRPRLCEFARRHWLPALAAAAAVAGLLAINVIRFGDFAETGMRYATGDPEQRAHVYDEGLLISPRWIPLNGWAYFLRPPEFDAGWPRIAWSESLEIPESMRDLFAAEEHIAIDTHSVIVLTPALLLALLAFSARAPSALRRLCLALVLGAMGVVAFLLCYAWCARRFTVDFLPISLVVAFVGVQMALQRRPRLAGPLLVGLSMMTLWSVALHWQLARTAARKVLAIFMLTEDGRLADLDRLPLLAVLLAAGVLVDFVCSQGVSEGPAPRGRTPDSG